MQRWLQRDDMPQSAKLTAVFVVVLFSHMVLGIASVLLVSLAHDIPPSIRGSVCRWVFVLGLANAGAGTWAVHRSLSDDEADAGPKQHRSQRPL